MGTHRVIVIKLGNLRGLPILHGTVNGA